MRTRSFIGLAFLVAALLLASTPQLLEPTSRGIERVAVKAGLLPDRAKELAKQRENDKSQTTKPPTSRLDLRGYTVEKGGDLVDTVSAERRAGGRTTRTAAGQRRALAPEDRWDGPLVSTSDGMLLDSGRCPVFRNDTEISELLADKAGMQAYMAKARKADDGNACQKQVRAELTRVNDLQRWLPGDRRRLEANLRSDSEQLLLEDYRVGVLGLLFDGVDASTIASDTRDALNTAR